jgi:hypothetical protein
VHAQAEINNSPDKFSYKRYGQSQLAPYEGEKAFPIWKQMSALDITSNAHTSLPRPPVRNSEERSANGSGFLSD